MSTAVVIDSFVGMLIEGYRMCAVTILCLTVCHPGIWFKPLVARREVSRKSSAESSQVDVEK